MQENGARQAQETQQDGRPDDEEIRKIAHHLWETEDRPEGRADWHWDAAKEILALKQSGFPHDDQTAEPVEPQLAIENQGIAPGLTDQAESVSAPSLQRGI